MSAKISDTKARPEPPEITVLSRVASIPMISTSLGTINDALSSNTFTSSSYSYAKDLLVAAHKLSEPLQVKLAPMIVRADSYANMAVDALASRFPYPFRAHPEEVTDYLRELKNSATNYVNEQASNVNNAIYEKVKAPVFSLIKDIDRRFSSIIDYLEAVVSPLNRSDEGSSAHPNVQLSGWQYQRVLVLSKIIYEYTSNHLWHLKGQLGGTAKSASELVECPPPPPLDPEHAGHRQFYGVHIDREWLVDYVTTRQPQIDKTEYWRCFRWFVQHLRIKSGCRLLSSASVLIDKHTPAGVAIGLSQCNSKESHAVIVVACAGAPPESLWNYRPTNQQAAIIYNIMEVKPRWYIDINPPFMYQDSTDNDY